MSHLDVLLPFALPPPEFAADLLKELHAPALARLLSRTRTERDFPRIETFEDFARALPHEAWFARHFGLEGPLLDESSPAVATALMQALGQAQDAGHWFIVQPVHIHIARDHLVLTDSRQLALTAQEARTLFDIARQVFEEAGKTLICGNEDTWFLRADEWSALKTSTPDAATGHNIDIWMPRGPHEREWRKLQNEVQMHWFNHAVNEKREAAGLRSVNSIWIWGGANAPAVPAAPAYRHAYNLKGWLRAAECSVPAAREAPGFDALPVPAESNAIVLLDSLLEAALANDWSTWLANFDALERRWFAPLLQAMQMGRIDSLALLLSDTARLMRFSTSRAAQYKFWIKPSLSPLLS